MRFGKDKQAGFTLIELLAVMVIISLMTAVVVISMPREKPAIEIEGQALARQFQIASQGSIISGVPQGFGVSSDGYVFYSFEEGEWVVESEASWPDNISIEFYKDDLRLDIPEEAVPLVVFEPLGLSTDFDLKLEGFDHSVIFSSDGDGKVSMETKI